MKRTNDPREPVACRYCDALIVWAKNEKTGLPMPFDSEPDFNLEKGWELRYRESDHELYARYRDTTGPRLRQPHFATCTNYDPQRKGPRSQPTPQQGDLVGRDHIAEVRSAMPPAYMEMYRQ